MPFKRARNLFSIVYLVCAFLITGCAGFYDYATKGVPLVYAFSSDGGILTIHIASEESHYAFEQTLAFTPSGISVNGRSQIMAWDASTTYVSQDGFSSLTSWTGSPLEAPIGLNDNFILPDNSDFMTFDMDTGTWTLAHTFSGAGSPITNIFQGQGQEAYFCVNNAPTSLDIYRLYESGSTLVSSNTYPTMPGSFTTGFRYGDTFYLCNTITTLENVFVVKNGVATSLNPTFVSGNSVSSIAVTEAGGIYLIVNTGGAFELRQISAVDTIITVISLGTSGSFTMPPLGRNRLVIAANSADTGYNGLYIFDIEKNAITTHFTDSDTFAVCAVY
ncbi:MAG: hypothetical protein CVV44_05095 [Spirochaetae bacterium HGW-Spirochaetae-1]|jgi:hypothetical protein|nr:MAG: hypothetical protein CVV44_05095 [Spirochaetae bacterium HGW-Spirochaetae-1]